MSPVPSKTPVPKFQLFLVLLVQLAEPITAEVIYPFIIGCVFSTGITNGDEKRTGYFAGIIESVFFIAESLTCTYWGRLSDFHGRRKILLIGPLGLTLAMLGFGLSKTFVALVIFRALQGIFNGNIGVSKTILAEIADPSNMADVFTLTPIMWAIGSTIGPALGGILANPASRWPHTFGKIPFFHEYPYLLPCAAAGSFALVAFVLCFIGLKESSTRFKSISPESISEENEPLLLDGEPQPGYDGVSPPPSKKDVKVLSIRELLTTPDLQIILLSYGLLSFTDMAYFVLIPLVYSSSIEAGGLGLSPYQVGLILGIYGFLNGSWNALVLRVVLKKIGPRKMYIISYASFLVIFPLLWILRDAAHGVGRVNALIWVLIVCQLLSATFIIAAYNSMNLLIVQNAPSGSLGTVNGLAQTVASGTRGLGPLFASSLFSVSLEYRLLGGHLVDIVLIALSAVGLYCAIRIPKHSA